MVLTRSGVYELEIIYVDIYIYIYFHWNGVTRAAFFELKRERIALIDGGKIEEERRFRRERGVTSVKGWSRCGKMAREGRRMFVISFSNCSKREREKEREEKKGAYCARSVVVRLSTSHAQSLFVLFAN